MSEHDPTLVWVDLEMTGLDVERCAIIEIAVVLTRKDLEPFAELHRIIWQPDEVLDRMDPFVREMHTTNGLLERVRASRCSLTDAENDALALVSSHCKFREGILAGNSVHADRRFLARYMPTFERFLHYRQVDVSTLKVLTRAWYPGTPKLEKEDKDHTALADIHASIDELRHYRQAFFRPT
ncbi:MAG TPA: oligoribonuclease [Candidatus Binatia bacterium]